MTTPARATDIVFTRHGARRGFAWLAEAYRMFWRAPLRWILLVFVYAVILYLTAIVPPLFLLLRPVFAVGLLAAAWTQERGGRPRVSHMFQGFRANLRALLALGGLSIAGITLAILATALFDGGALLELIARDPSSADADRAASTEALLKSGRLQTSMLIAATLSLPTVLALWFAPALVVFQDAGAFTAIGASLRAALANWRPVVVYGIAIVLFGLPLVLVRPALVMFPGDAGVAIVYLAYVAYWLMFSATLHVADYVSYRDVFHAGETLAPLPLAQRRDTVW